METAITLTDHGLPVSFKERVREIQMKIGELTMDRQSDYVEAANMALEIKRYQKDVEAALDEKIKAAHEQHKALTTLRNMAIREPQRAEKVLKAMLIGYLEGNEERREALQKELDEAGSAAIVPSFVAKVEGLSFVRIEDVELVDADSVPKEFLAPDMRGIRKAVKDGRKEIPGIRVFKRVVPRFTVKGA